MKSLAFLIVFGSTLVTFSQITPTYNDVLIPTRDGYFLSADVYIPDNITDGEVILVQTPYNKNNFSWSLPLGIGQNVNDQPFIWVIVDWRGFYGSAAAAIPSPNRGEDAYDICDWIVGQSWHKSRIGTWGPSALGKIQYDLARQQHPNHTCAVPIVAHPQFAYTDYFYGGVLEEARLEQLDALGYGLSPIVMANVYYSNTWTFTQNSSWYPTEINIPTLQIGGWYDHNIDKMIEWYGACRNQSPQSDKQWLLVGPWVHGGTGAAYVGSSIQGELTYPDAAFKSDSMAWDFFNYYLLDSTNNWNGTSKITYYQTGQGGWGESNAATIAISNYDEVFLNTNGELTSGSGTGSTLFVSDPLIPAPTIGGATLHPDLDQGPFDQTSLEGRPDIITFSSDALPSNVTVSGKVLCNLFVESNQPDCDIVVHLVDEYPDGRDMLITDGIRRMRFRNGYTQASESFMSPGSVYNVEIDLPFVHYTWEAGHKFKIYIGGNSSIRWNVNLQDGGPMYTNATPNVADIRIHHDEQYPSRLKLPGNNSFLDIKDLESKKLIVYPNPVENNLHFNTAIEGSYFAISNALGATVISGKISSGHIDLSQLERGVYFLEVIQGSEHKMFKILKN